MPLSLSPAARPGRQRGVTVTEVEMLALVCRLFGPDAVSKMVVNMGVDDPDDAVRWASEMAGAQRPAVVH